METESESTRPYRSWPVIIKPILFLAAALLMASAVTAQNADDFKILVPEGPHPWTHLEFAGNPDNFQFAIIADLTSGLRPGVFERAVEDLNLLRPEFVMCVGDLIQGGTTDTSILESQWNEFQGWIAKLRAPFFYLPGNHDVGNETAAATWRRRLGPSYYHFVYRDVLFLVANTDDPPERSISQQQLAYFREVLESNRDVRWTIAFLHRPTWLADYSGKTPVNGERFEALFRGRPHTVFAGHDHKYGKSVRNGYNYYILATTGAQGRGETYLTSRGNSSMKLLGMEQGEFDHIMWVTMTAKGPVVANILLDGILGDDPGKEIDN